MKPALLALACTVLAPLAALADLKIENVRPAYGPIGPDRDAKKPLVAHPAEELFFRYTVIGAKVNDQGAVDCTVAMKLTNAEGKEVLKDSHPTRGVIPLGGDRFPGIASIRFGPMVAEGKYKLSVTVTDAISKESVDFTQDVEVKRTDGLVLVNRRFFYDPNGQVPAPPGGLVDQKLFFRAQLVGFDRSQKKLRARMELMIHDRDGKAQMPKPLVVKLSSDDEARVAAAQALTFTGNIALNRAGEFTLRVRFVDEIADKDVRYETPLTVRE